MKCEVDINVLEIVEVQTMLETVGEMLADERIDEAVRVEYIEKMKGVL